MKKSRIPLIFIFGLLFEPLWAQEQREQEIADLLMANDMQAVKYNKKITFIMEVNMGIPGGENWLVEWYDENDTTGNYVYVYSINGNDIIKSLLFTVNFNPERITVFDIMRNIPGTRVGTGTCVVYDYNDDGFDEVCNLGIWGMGTFVNISGYDTEKDKKIFYTDDFPFGIVDPDRGPAPVQFITYKGKKGFIAYHIRSSVDRDPVDPRNHTWLFYAWNGSTRSYEEVGEYIEEKEAQETDSANSNVDATPETTDGNNAIVPAAATEKPESRFELFVSVAVIAVCIIAFASILVLRRKRKGKA